MTDIVGIRSKDTFNAIVQRAEQLVPGDYVKSDGHGFVTKAEGNEEGEIARIRAICRQCHSNLLVDTSPFRYSEAFLTYADWLCGRCDYETSK